MTLINENLKNQDMFNNQNNSKSPFYKFKVLSNIFSASLVILMIIAIVMAYFDVLPRNICPWLKNNSVDATDFYTSFIALCTTFVVGFQIYSSIVIGNKIEKLDKELDRQKRITKQMISDNLECKYFNAYTVGLTRYNEIEFGSKGEKLRYCWNSIRAYMNALNIAAEGGHDFHEAVTSFGNKKILNCINALDAYHKNDKKKNYKNENSGGEYNVSLPSYGDRMKYISDINHYICEVNNHIEDSKEYFRPLMRSKREDFSLNYRPIRGEDIKDFNTIVAAWNDFILRYYSDSKR